MATTAAIAPTKKFWKLQEFVAHGQSVNCLALGKSGRVMVTGGEDKKVNLWAIGKPSCIMSLTGHTTAVECVKFGHSDDLVCAGSKSGALKIWDLEAAKILRTLTGHKENAKCVDFHPYADFLASGSSDTNIKLWDIRRKGCVYTYKGHSLTVNSLVFSPDGRWIASGGDDGTVKLWDLSAGKMLKEFRGHMGPVSDVQYHPNEFLLASSSTDSIPLDILLTLKGSVGVKGIIGHRSEDIGGSCETVKFWDLESFQLVSSSEADASVRCIHFNPEGDCLFAGAQDSLKVFGWEPPRTYDSLVMGWGKVTDMVTFQQQQLLAGAYSLTNVSVYIVDLKRVQPFYVPPAKSKPQYIPQSSSTFTSRHHMRRSFSRSQSNKDSLVDVKMVEDADVSTPEVDPGDDQDSFADIQQAEDYNEIFHPRRELSRSPEPESSPVPFEDPFVPKKVESNSKLIRPSERTHVPPLGKTFDKVKLSSTTTMTSSSTFLMSQRQSMPLNSTYTKLSDMSSKTVTVSPTPSHLVLSKPSEKQAFRPQSMETSVSVVRPIISPLEQQNCMDFVPEQRETPAGLDMDEFLPRHLQDTLRLGGNPHFQMSEAEALCSISQGHQSMMTALTHRRKNLQIVLAQWSSRDVRAGLDTAIQMNDLSVIVDMLNVFSLRPAMWNLDMCQVLVPAIYNLLQSKYESYMGVGCSALKVILKSFATVIKTNISAPPGVGVDIPREERYNKCMSCYNQLLSVRAFLLKRQTLQGKLGQSFRELQIMMQALE